MNVNGNENDKAMKDHNTEEDTVKKKEFVFSYSNKEGATSGDRSLD